MQAYDLVAGATNLARSKYLSASESMHLMPTLAPASPEGRALKGTVRGLQDRGSLPDGSG